MASKEEVTKNSTASGPMQLLKNSNIRLCLCVLCGLPGSGKSSLARTLRETVEKLSSLHVCFHLEYDKVITVKKLVVPQGGESPSSESSSLPSYQTVEPQSRTTSAGGGEFIDLNWKEQRSQLIQLLDQFLSHVMSFNKPLFSKPDGVPDVMWGAFREMIPRRLTCLGTETLQLVVLLDDNMHLHSMRHPFLTMARKFNAGFCEVFLDTPVTEALLRNRSRSLEQRVPDDIIVNMASRLECPNRQKVPWERHVLILKSDGHIEMESVLQLLHEAMDDPECLIPDNAVEKAVSRYECSVSTLHQIDLILRKCVAEHMAKCKDLHLTKQELKDYSQKANQAKLAVVQEFKRSNQDYLHKIANFSVVDAFKDKNSDLFKFISALFMVVFCQYSVSD